MRRVSFELDYHAAWKEIFGPNSNKVEILEALRCFKCDISGIAIVCKIKLKNNKMNLKDLSGEGLLTNLEILYKEKDGSMVVFIEGRGLKASLPRPSENPCVPKLLMSHPPEFLSVDTMKAEVIGTEKEIKNFLQYAGKWNSFKILGLTSLDTKSESLLSRLTNRQKQVIITAYALGYYDVPRKITSEDLARHFNADKSTIVEHLRKAQRKLIGGLIAT